VRPPVKRRNFLFDEIASYANIRLAFLKAIRGKRSASESLLFCRDLEKNLETARLRLLAETVRLGRLQILCHHRSQNPHHHCRPI